MPGKAHRIGPHSRATALARLDGRTREAKEMREIAAALTEHLGGDLTPPQQMLVQMTGVLWLRLSLMAPQMLTDPGQAERYGSVFLAWVNALRRNLAELGVKPQEVERVPSLKQYLAEKAA